MAEQVFRLRFQLSTGQAEAVTKLRSARKDLARVKTLLRERELRKQYMATETAAAAAPARHQRQELTGVVTSAKMEKTIVVKVTRLVQHKLYTRVMRVTKKFYAHDEKREARLGDTVKIVETRPMSKLKRWRLAEVLRRSTRVN